MNFTDEQRDAINARGKTIVSASAGSGKTSVMIERCISLIENEPSFDVRRMLAVTFTNKAASQMREKMRKNLQKRILCAEGETKARLKEQYERLPLADISTIHAFCGRLIRTYFYYLGIDPAFRIIASDDAEGKALQTRALSETLEEGYESGGESFGKLLTAYFRKKKDSKLRKNVLDMYEKVRNIDDYRSVLIEIRDGNRDDFTAAAEYLAEDFRRRARSVVERANKALKYALKNGFDGAEVCEEIIKAAEQVLKAEDLFAMRRLPKPALPRCPSEKKKDPLERRYSAASIKALAAAVKDIYEDQKRDIADDDGKVLVSYGKDAEYERYENAREQTRALAGLVLRFDEVYFRLKQEAGVLDYGDLEHLAIRLLQDDDHPEARSSVQDRYRYVFVDEYQDVNPLQEKIVSLVAEHGDLFLVGDKKQAIYAFRGSRSSFFTETEKDFYDREGANALQLNQNFRSTEAVLSAVNAVFQKDMDGYPDMYGGTMYGERRGEVDMVLIGKEKAPKSDMGIYSVLTGKKEEARSRVAEEVVRLIKAEYGRPFFDADAKPNDDPDAKPGMVRPVEYGDIAVLVRTNEGEASAIVRLLSEQGIPVTSAAKINVCDFFEVRLILDWLSYLDNPEQDIPMVTAMLSAVGGFDERELATIRLAVKGKMPFREACARYAQRQDAIAVKLQNFYQTTQDLRALSRVKTAQEIISHLLGLGLEAQIAAKGEASHRLARVGRLIAESATCSNIHSLLKRVRDTEDELNFTEGSGEGAVRIVTMHSSKGLEFPIVILAELDGTFRSPFRDEILWTDEFRIAPKCFMEVDGEKIVDSTILRDAAGLKLKRDAVNGELNLLYVAMTRAKNRLHIVLEAESAREVPQGEEDLQFTPQDANRLSDFLPIDHLQKIGVSVQSAEGPVPSSEQDENEAPTSEETLQDEVPVYDEALVQQILSSWQEYPHAESTRFPVKSSATEIMRSRERTPVHHTVSDEAPAAFTTEEGTAYHAFLEHVVFGRSAEEELARMEREGALPEEEFALLDPDRLKTILSMPCLQGLAGKKLYREQTFLLLLPACEMMDTAETDEIVFQGAIDLLIEEDGKYSIVDYKLSSHDDEEIRATYAPQIKLYRKAVARAKGVREEDIPARILNIARCREIDM